MRYLVAVVFCMSVLMSISAMGQEGGMSQPACFEPLSLKYSEFDFTTPNDLNVRTIEFAEKLGESTESQGIVFVFGGRKTRMNEINEIAGFVEKAFNVKRNDYVAKVLIREGGYRERPGIVFLLKPLKCSDYSHPIADFSEDQVEFAEFPTTNTIRVSTGDLHSSLLTKAITQCPPAARAVRACSDGTEARVFVIVDAKGQVAVSKTIGGHPLLRIAAEAAAKQFKFKEFTEKGKPFNRSGILVVRFIEGSAVISSD